MKANNACGSGSPRTLVVTVTPTPPQPGTISGNTSVCQGSSQTYSVASVTGAQSYTWTLPGGWSGSSTTRTITCTAGTSGGTISVKANNSCGSGVPRTLNVSVVTATIPTLTYPSAGSTGVPRPVNFNWNDVAGNSPQYRIQVSTSNSGWTPQNGFTSGTGQSSTIRVNQNTGSTSAYSWTSSAAYPPQANKKYYWTVKSYVCNQSSNYSSVRSFTTSSTKSDEILEFTESMNELTIYPNPFNNEIMIDFFGNIEPVNYCVINSLGKIIHQGIFTQQIVLQTEKYAPGVYFIRFENSAISETRKVIK